MMYLVQGQENTPYLLNFHAVGRPTVSPYTDTGGRLIDPVEVKFQIRDPSGADIFPGAGGYEVVTGTPGELGRGRFYAYDDAFSIGWTPSASATVGTYEIEWRWTEESGGDELRWVQKFRVESSSKFSGSSFATYISPGEIRDVIPETDLPDGRLEQLIELAQSYIERATRNLFRPVYMELVQNGGHHEAIFLQYPVIGIDEVYANNSSAPLSARTYAVAYERVDQLHRFNPPNDRRRNPWIRFRGGTSTIFDSPPLSRWQSQFFRGANNQIIRGVFGFLESDGSCPRLITEAMLRLVSLNTPKISPGSAGNALAGPISSETVDRHSISYSVSKSAQANTKWALAGSKEVEEILAMYKAPLVVNAPTPKRVWDTGFEAGAV